MLQHPRKRFGQNFLVDKNIINKIISAINPQPADNIVEIGPGRGALTYPLLKRVAQLTVIEIDRDLANSLAKPGQLTVHCDDVLAFDFRSIAKNSSIRIAGNLPYNISTPLLFHLFNYADNIVDMYFMLQKEVVDRLVSKPGSKNYGRLSVMAQYYSRIEKLFEVSPSAFQPPPKVVSAVVRLIPHQQRALKDTHENDFADLVKLAFSQRRKTLRNNLKPISGEEALGKCGIESSRRAETLSLNEFIALQKQINGHTSN